MNDAFGMSGSKAMRPQSTKSNRRHRRKTGKSISRRDHLASQEAQARIERERSHWEEAGAVIEAIFSRGQRRAAPRPEGPLYAPADEPDEIFQIDWSKYKRS